MKAKEGARYSAAAPSLAADSYFLPRMGFFSFVEEGLHARTIIIAAVLFGWVRTAVRAGVHTTCTA